MRPIKRIETTMRMVYRCLCAIVCLLLVLVPFSATAASTIVQDQDPSAKAQATLAMMSPEQKVGQLFLVTFKGNTISAGSPIYDLIANGYIGGVNLLANNDNFTGPDGTVDDVYRLTTELQQIPWDAVQSSESLPGFSPPLYIPLFIGISQEGGGFPHDQIINGITPLPSPMSIGATWRPEYARSVGIILGTELRSLGFNLLIGPSLDVLDVSQTQTGEDLGIRTYGGDPYWVGELGKAYIEGVHEGSNQQVAVISKHFPGRGGSDRPPNEEIATVRKSLEQLKQIELAPFFTVTSGQAGTSAATDGMLLSHIRYQGFQGNIRATTRPVSFDQGALEQIMGLPIFSEWRQAGGIIVSDDLGSLAVRRFFDPSGTSFDARQIVRNAFLAGNDLLYMDNIQSSGEPDSYTTIKKILAFFAQRYREDETFARRVDASVERLLFLKYQFYGNFELIRVLPPKSDLVYLGQSTLLSSEIAHHSATLLSPDVQDLGITLSEPPTGRERIVFFTDTLSSQQCSTCASQDTLSVDGLQKAVLRLYGISAGGQIQGFLLSSFSFGDLTTHLNDPEKLPEIEDALRAADWIVFSIQNVRNEQPESQALRRFLAERPDLIGKNKIVTFAFNAPYYLDATDISKLTAYYGLFSNGPAFTDIAARLLFQEITPLGHSPVSVSGVGYDLLDATTPNPNQVLSLFLDIAEIETQSLETENTTETPEPGIDNEFRTGDMLPLRTSMIVDHNLNPVPDGTVARFFFSSGEGGAVQQVESTTVGGVARISYRIMQEGFLEVRVTSDPAMVSDILQLEIRSDGPIVITALAPTAVSSPTAEVISSPTPIPAEILNTDPETGFRPGLWDWIAVNMLIWGAGFLIYRTGKKHTSQRWGVRWGLSAVTGGWALYALTGLLGWGMPTRGSLLLLIVIGIGGGWLAGWLWWQQIGLHRTRSRR